jgi:two-component system, NtrC family, sensor kinase
VTQRREQKMDIMWPSHNQPPPRAAEYDLLDRPTFNFRLQIILGFFTFFILSVVITAGAMLTIHRIEQKISIVQTWEQFLFNIEQARRWEKNYFLYGTNLQEAFQSIEEARRILEENIRKLEIMSIPWQKEEIIRHLDLYLASLKKLDPLVINQFNTAEARQRIEADLRHYGSQMVSEAAALAAKEHELVNKWLVLVQKVPAYFLIFLFFLMLYMARFLSLRFMQPLKSLVQHTRRIAKGDFTPLKPVRKYRDEFTTVEVAINRMLKELESRQNSLIESHKLRAVGILTAGVAHELNNPLNNIMLTAHALLEEYDDMSRDEHVGMINDIIQETDRSRAIVHNLLDFTRENKSVMQPLALGRLVSETAKLTFNQARVRGVTINVHIEPELPRILGDPQQLKQVFLNLVLNALDAVEKGGKIDIRVKSPKSHWISVHIEDNGCGIPADVMSNIFDPFFTTKPVGKGTGLGLSVSHGIISNHGGRIEVASEPGKFTVFTVNLPTEPSTEQPSKERRDPLLIADAARYAQEGRP